MFFPFNGSLSSRFFWLAVSILFILLASSYAWNRFKPHVAANEAYHLTPTSLTITDQPEFLISNVKEEVFTEIQEQKMSLLDTNVLENIAQTLNEHRCVEGVYTVSKTQAGIIAEIEYRKPIAAVEVIDNGKSALIPVSQTCFPIDTLDLKRETIESLPRVNLLGDSSGRILSGTKWELSYLAEALSVVKLLKEKKLLQTVTRITMAKPVIAEIEEPEFVLQMVSGHRVFWGKAVASSKEKDPRSAALIEAIKQIQSMQQTTDFDDLDISTGRLRRVMK